MPRSWLGMRGVREFSNGGRSGAYDQPGLKVARMVKEYTEENKIEPTEEEIRVFLDKQEEMSQRSLVEYEQERVRLVEELKSKTLTEEQRKEKQSELGMAEETLKTQGETREGAKQMEEQLRPMLRSMALQQVRTWKINQALFKKYGGRVIFQQAGVEPLDAVGSASHDAPTGHKLFNFIHLPYNRAGGRTSNVSKKIRS